MDRPKLEVADVRNGSANRMFRRYGEAYRQQHGASMSVAQWRVMTALEVCRTAALGGHLERCDQCGYERNAFNSCRDRHCPKCQCLARAQWIEELAPGSRVFSSRAKSTKSPIDDFDQMAPLTSNFC